MLGMRRLALWFLDESCIVTALHLGSLSASYTVSHALRTVNCKEARMSG
jgi:hypothetical protein